MSQEHNDSGSNQSVLNLDKAVKNIASESAKSNYNPEIDMNWCHLPMEMRLECVKRMDFKQRCRFRRTSKAEKSLVDAKKYQFNHFKIVHSRDSKWSVNAKKGPESCQLEVHSENRDAPDYSCISAILKHAEVKNFPLSANDFYGTKVLPLLEHMEKFAPFGFERVSVFYNPSIGFFMKNCVNLKKVDFCGGFQLFPFKEILEAPSLMNVKEFKFGKVHSEAAVEFLKELVQKWIDNDAGIGKSVQCSMFFLDGWPPAGEAISVFAETFSDRVIENTEKEIRIRMNNETTQILLRQFRTPENAPANQDVMPWEYVSCKVIPIDLSKSQYANGDGWIQAIHEKDLKLFGKLKNPAQFDAEDEAIWGEEYKESDLGFLLAEDEFLD